MITNGTIYKINIFIIIYSLFTISACTPHIHISGKQATIKPLAADADVLVIDAYHEVPDTFILLGKLKTGGNVFNYDCGYNNLVDDAKAAARKVGGNVIKITEVLEPDIHNSCYRIKANILYCKNMEYFESIINSVNDSITRSKFPEDPDYAILYVYRTAQPDGYERGYNLHLNDSVICRINKNCRQEIKLYKKGLNALWGETEARDSAVINVKFGEEYFLKCTLKMGILIGRPDMELMPKELGRFEYEH